MYDLITLNSSMSVTQYFAKLINFPSKLKKIFFKG